MNVAHDSHVARSLATVYGLRNSTDLKQVLRDIQQGDSCSAPFDLERIISLGIKLTVVPQMMALRRSSLLDNLTQYEDIPVLLKDAYMQGGDSLFFACASTDKSMSEKWLSRMTCGSLIVSTSDDIVVCAASVKAFVKPKT